MYFCTKIQKYPNVQAYNKRRYLDSYRHHTVGVHFIENTSSTGIFRPKDSGSP